MPEEEQKSLCESIKCLPVNEMESIAGMLSDVMFSINLLCTHLLWTF